MRGAEVDEKRIPRRPGEVCTDVEIQEGYVPHGLFCGFENASENVMEIEEAGVYFEVKVFPWVIVV